MHLQTVGERIHRPLPFFIRDLQAAQTEDAGGADVAFATELLSMTEENFESEGWGGQRWKQSRRAADEGGKTLQKSGQLAASLTTQVGSNYARIGSNKKYAAIHHLGGQAGRGHKTNLPARPYLPINGNNQLQPDAERRILDIAITALKKGL